MIRTIFIRKCARKEKTQYEEFKEADCYYHGYRSYDSMYSNGFCTYHYGILYDTSVTKLELTKKNTTITCSTLTYTGKKQTPKTIKVQYKTKSGKKVTLKAGTDYTVKVTSGKNAGTYSVKITGKGKYAGKVSSSYTIKKATQKKLKVKNGYKTKKASTFKKKAKSYTFKVSGVKDKAKVTYQRSSKKIVVKKGKITLAKGIKKGTYRVTVKVAATKNYKATTKTIKIKVK